MNNSLTLEHCMEVAKHNNGLCLSSIYVNNKHNLEWQCENNHIWKAPLDGIKNRNDWCPYCPIAISKPQQELYDILCKQYNFPIVLNDRFVIKPKHLDIFIPSLKIAIEYDGEYWHYSDWAIKNGSLDKMKIKDDICANINIILLRIREKDWLFNKAQEVNKIIDIIDKYIIAYEEK